MKKTLLRSIIAATALLIVPVAAKAQTATTGTAGDPGTIVPIWSTGSSSGGTPSDNTSASGGDPTPSCQDALADAHGKPDPKAHDKADPKKTHKDEAHGPKALRDKADQPKPHDEASCDELDAAPDGASSGSPWRQELLIDNGGWKFR